MSFSFRRRDIPLKELVQGDFLSLTAFDFLSGKPGPHVYVQASVHGAEVQGNLVIWELMKYFSEHPFNGSLTFLPSSNPSGMNQKNGTSTAGRFHPVTGDNWNRVFENIHFDYDDFSQRHFTKEWSEIKNHFKQELLQALNRRQNELRERGISEQKNWALTLQKEASQADIVLDLHTGPISTSYIYSAQGLLHKSLDLNFSHYISIPHEFAGAMDEASFMPWFKLQAALKKFNRQAPEDVEVYTLELGSEDVLNSDRSKRYTLSILHYLKKRGVVTTELPAQEIATKHYKCLLENYRTYYASHGGLVEYLKAPGELVLKGETLATFLNFKNIHQANELEAAKIAFKSPQDALIINRCPSANVTQGMELFFVMEKFELI